MQPKRPLPGNRTCEQLENQNLVKKTFADKLRKANREERRGIYATMYDGLFSLMPEYAKLQHRKDDAYTAHMDKGKLALVDPYLNRDMTFAEFDPGDYRFPTCSSIQSSLPQ